MPVHLLNRALPQTFNLQKTGSVKCKKVKHNKTRYACIIKNGKSEKNSITGKQNNAMLKSTQHKEEEKFTKLQDRSKEVTYNVPQEVK